MEEESSQNTLNIPKEPEKNWNQKRENQIIIEQFVSSTHEKSFFVNSFDYLVDSDFSQFVSAKSSFGGRPFPRDKTATWVEEQFEEITTFLDSQDTRKYDDEV